MQSQIWKLVFAALVLGSVPGLARAEHLFVSFAVPGATNTWAEGINNVGVIVGITRIGDTFSLFERDAAGNFTTFGAQGAGGVGSPSGSMTPA